MDPIDLRSAKKPGQPNRFIETLKQPAVYVPLIFLVLVVPLIGTQIYHMNHDTTSSGSTPKKPFSFVKNTNTVAMATSPLDGLKYPADVANRHTLGVMIENHPDARPQFGLTDASVVYEAQAEGGITRFLALFGPKLPEKVGPVRSTRTYYLDWCLEYDCFLAHVGGNIDALDKIPQVGIKDLDQFRYGTKAYYRQPHNGVATEHTMYADPTKLYDIAQSNNWPSTGEFPTVNFKDDAPVSSRPSGQDITIEISSKQYNTEWIYDPTTDTYARNMGGTPHRDGKTGDQIRSKVVIVQEVPTRPTVTRINEQGLIMDTVGTGKARVFQDGIETDGTWKKTGLKDRTVFYYSTGTEVKFDAGQRWVTIVTPGSKVAVTAPSPAPSTTSH